ncbi:YhaN family protein [Bradyrhizobium sp. LTSPM299]|uniref:ATP-binding protein n=1 Tax=Bradyrhizobium sp. LTSPM299 TaxID=1619233 RepID=UPI0005C81E72|nr:YhaN family protein [Bradyrhizobium sp. LTSPM299]
MRFRQLDLLRYGHFTDATIALPAGKPDFQVLLGENEAGKSTAMNGVEDLLFGIPTNSSRNFLHEYNTMRVGALLEKGSDTLKVRRRKGNKDTLLGDDDTPISSGEGALAPFLAGADRSFFTRMFSLDHERLRQGGKEILQAQDDVGQMLFSASAGITGLRETLKAMEAEADSLWAARRAAHRKYFPAEERLKAAEASMRDNVVTATKWQSLKSAFETANDAYGVIESEIELKSAELRKLNRIRRVCRNVGKRAETQSAIDALREVIPFDADASNILEKAAKDEAAATARIATLSEQIAARETECAALIFDDALLTRAEDIAQLHDRRIQVRAEKADLPKRRAELAAAEATLNRLAGELEWSGDIDRLIARIPAKAKVAVLRGLLNRRGAQSGAVQNAQSAVAEAEEKLGEIAAEIEVHGPATDVSKLATVIKGTRELGDIAGQIANSKREEQEARTAIARLLKALRPAVADAVVLESMVVPPLASVEAHRDACRSLEQRQRTCGERIRNAEQERVRHRKAHERIVADAHVVAADELERLRGRRDTGWSIIRRRHVEGVAVSEDEMAAFGPPDALAQEFEAAMRGADRAADRRFEHADAAAQLAVIGRQIGEQDDLLESLGLEEQALAQERTTRDAGWAALWSAGSITPQDPDLMIEWLRTRSEILDLNARLSAAERHTGGWQQREDEGKRLVMAELETLGVSTTSLAAQPLHLVIETAAAQERRHENAAKTARDLNEAHRKAAGTVARKRKDLEKAEAEWTEWTSAWQAALKALLLAATATPETAEAQIDAIDDMREAAVRINELRHERIEKIERDVKVFEADVAALAQAIAPRLAGTDPDEAVLELDRQAADAARVRDLKAAKDSDVAGLQEKTDQCRESSREARETITQLQQKAGVASTDELRIAIQRSDETRKLKAELDRITTALMQDGDGLSVTELDAECSGIDPDAIAAKDQTVTEEVQELHIRQMEAREARNTARQAFGAIGGDDRAARDAADRQAALAEMTEIAEQYVRLRSAIVLLQWAIDRYRREKQAPMLKRAGELFAILTCGSFQTLQLEFDEHDNMHLAGLRRDGRRVPVAGMSTGTADQLYLALRIAAIEDYLDHAEPMPFIADDLFINFDDKRGAAGFRVLGELAKKTQVLFFTHHEHLLEVARKALGAAITGVTLPVAANPPQPRSEAA